MPDAADARVVVYSAAERRYCTGLLARFSELHPRVEVELHDGISSALHRRYLERSAAGQPHADVLWSSAMDLQMELVHAGRAAAYRSAHRDDLPGWAVYRDCAYATTLEPLVAVVDRSTVGGAQLAGASLAEVTALLRDQAGRPERRVACVDIESNGLGFLALVRESLDARRFGDFLNALASCRPLVCDSQRALVHALEGGDASIALHVLGAYAARAIARNPALALAGEDRGALAVSRVALVCADAPHHDAAKLFVDFLLSAGGQQALDEDGLFSLRAARQEWRWRPISLADGLPEVLDTRRRQAVLRAWRRAVQRNGA
jgi:iron(III) transport system substrate-binding protein